MAAENKAPAHLSDKSKKIWKSVVPSDGKTLPRQTLILAALESLDRADAARAIIDKEGMLLLPGEGQRGIAHCHPLLKVEKDSRALFAKLWVQMHMQYEARFLE